MGRISKNAEASWAGRLGSLLEDRNRSAVARALGWPTQRISQMIGRCELPNVIDALRLCQYLKVTVEEVFGVDAGAAVSRTTRASWMAHAVKAGAWKRRLSLVSAGKATVMSPEDFKGQRGFVPVLAPIAAGLPREAHDQGFPVGAAEAYIQYTCDDPNAFALRVDGDSMMPDFRHGDIIIVSPKMGKSNDTYRDGMAAVVVFGSEQTATFKLLRFEARRGRREHADYVLEPINRHHPKMRLKYGEIAAIHPVIGLARLEAGP